MGLCVPHAYICNSYHFNFTLRNQKQSSFKHFNQPNHREEERRVKNSHHIGPLDFLLYVLILIVSNSFVLLTRETNEQRHNHHR